MKRKSKPDVVEPQKFSAGETVMILRPNMWSGACGEVVSFKDGLHRVRIKNKQNDESTPYFHTDVKGSELEEYI